jgi:hypothetical protein
MKNVHHQANLALPMKNVHHQANLALPMRNSRQVNLALPMKVLSLPLLLLAWPMSSAGSLHRPHGVLTQKRKGVDVAGTEKMGLVLPFPLQASARKSTTKWTAPVSTGGGQPGIGVRQRRPLKRGKQFPSNFSI